MFIRTERLFLRPAWPEDMSEMLDIVRNDVAGCGGGNAGSPPPTEAELRACLERPREKLLPHFLINLREEGGAKLIGSVGLQRVGPDVELGYWITRKRRGRGYAAEAVRAVLAEARMLGHRQIVASYVADHEASARVLERCGFRPTAEVRAGESARREDKAAAKLYLAILTDKLFDMLGVGPQAPQAPQAA